MAVKTITLAGGCFWCLEAVYDRVKGVLDVVSGYSNGHDPKPSYERVCSGQTGHAEVVRIQYDTECIEMEQVLEIFFVIHDPTTLNRQGHDVGTQYRSGIYLETKEDEQRVHAFIANALPLMGLQANMLTTEVCLCENFHPAEEYHQNYFEQHPQQGYCAHVVAPKVQKFQDTFHALLKA
jgi:peptide-methionine (S)-S-oxide reductase